MGKDENRGNSISAVYTYSEARQNLAAVLDRAARDGEARIKRKDGQTFVVRLETTAVSPLAVEGVDLGLTQAEIVGFVQAGRREWDEA